jgi:CRP-like cAMP-binding protein
LTLEYFEPNTEIFQTGDRCNAIYFIVDGEVDLFINVSQNEEYLLDTLYHSCCIGSYSFLKAWPYPYSARAKKKVTLLVLHYQAFIDAKEYIEDLEFALWDA